MCGRFTLTSTGEALARALDVDPPADLAPHYNVAPGQDVWVVLADAEGRRRLETRRWGLVPRWPLGRTPLATCTLLTTEAAPSLRELHDRMPVILDPDAVARWLAPDAADPVALRSLLRPCPDAWLSSVPVSRRVNDPRHDDPACLESLFDEEVPRRL